MVGPLAVSIRALTDGRRSVRPFRVRLKQVGDGKWNGLWHGDLCDVAKTRVGHARKKVYANVHLKA